MHEAADLLVAAGDVELRERLREKFPTGALAVIDFAFAAWGRIHAHSGRLDRYVTPRAIAAATSDGCNDKGVRKRASRRGARRMVPQAETSGRAWQIRRPSERDAGSRE